MSVTTVLEQPKGPSVSVSGLSSSDHSKISAGKWYFYAGTHLNKPCQRLQLKVKWPTQVWGGVFMWENLPQSLPFMSWPVESFDLIVHITSWVTLFSYMLKDTSLWSLEHLSCRVFDAHVPQVLCIMITCQQSLPVLLFSYYSYFGGFLQFLSNCMSRVAGVHHQKKNWFYGIYTLQT